jgi:DNA processing protein
VAEVDTRFALMLSLTNGIGPAKYQKLIKRYHDYDSLKSNADREFLKECNLTDSQIRQITEFENWHKIDEILENAAQLDVKIICLGQTAYPDQLANIYSPPPVIYLKGKLEYLGRPAIAVVGSRTPTAYGKSMAAKITSDLAARGLIIISGLAWGIDAQSHQAAIDVGGATGAVFGCGIDIIYPSNHRDLADKILERGFWISEFPFGTQPDKFNFPRRNRIISGLAQAVLVVEAAARSGALVTANLAVDQGRDVFAVPGQADNPKSDGTINLIKQGAFVATSADDILESIGWDISAQRNQTEIRQRPVEIALEPDEQRVCDLIGRGPLQFDELARTLGLTSAKLSAMLLKLELAGLVTRQPGNYLART